jgi:hypothetical protein
MWKTLALTVSVLALAVLGIAAAPRLLPAPAAPELKQRLIALPVQPALQTFAAVCRDDAVVNRRPDPAWVRQSYIGDNCQAPSQPAVIDGYTASREKIVAGMAAAKSYAAAADNFRQCVSAFVTARKTDSARSLTPSQVIIQNHRILASEKSQETVAAQMNMAIMAFNSYGSDCPM